MRLREGLSLCVRGALCAAMCALTLGASSAKAAPLPAGLESSCPFAGCVISYSDPMFVRLNDSPAGQTVLFPKPSADR